MKIISITGPESSGKTSFASYCASRLIGAQFIGEYSRSYLEKNYPDGVFPKSVISTILETQLLIWQKAMAKRPAFLILDGDIFIYKIWIKYVYGETWDIIENYIAHHPSDLIVVCRPDIPWVSDPLRTNPNDRDVLFEMYLQEIQARTTPYLILEGGLDARNSTTLELVARTLSIDHSEQQ